MEKTSSKPKIMWTSDDWDKIAIALHLKHPEQNYHIAEKLSLGLGPVMAAMRQAIDEPRWRVLHTGNDYKPYLLKAYSRLRVTLVSHEATKAAAIKEITTTNESETNHHLHSDSSNDNVVSDNDSQPGGVPGETKQSRVFWTPYEWLQIARELYRIRPELLNSDTLVGVKTPDMLLAQKVLPEDRYRHSLLVMAPVRLKLKEAFGVIKAEQQAQEATRKAQEASDTQAATLAARNPYEVALEPLMKLLAAEVIKGLTPVLMKALALSSIQLGAQEHRHNPQPKPDVLTLRKPKIGIVGCRDDTAQHIADLFPQLDFVITGEDAPNVVMAVQNCEKVLGLKWINHPDMWKLRKALGDRFTMLGGGISEAKRVLSALLTSGAIQRQQATH